MFGYVNVSMVFKAPGSSFASCRHRFSRLCVCEREFCALRTAPECCISAFIAMTSLGNFRWGVEKKKLDQDVTVRARSQPVAAGLVPGMGGRVRGEK